MTVGALILLHYKERDEPNAPKIVNALKSGSVVPKIVVFIDNPEIEFGEPDVTIIRSSHPFPVIARNGIGALLDTDYVFFQDSDLSVEEKTIEYMLDYAKDYPNAVLGFEGCRLANTPTPYTDGETIDRSDKLEEVDMLIRTWLIPSKVVGMAINLYLNNKGMIPSKYTDDILFCLGNRYGFGNPNYALPIKESCGVIELGEKGVGQYISPGHFQTRNQVCRYLMNAK